MLLLAGAVLGLLAGLLTGGSLRNVVEHRLQWPLLVVVAFAVRELLVRSPIGASSLVPAAFVAALLLLIAWTLWHFHALPGIWLVSLGMAMNLLVVLANAGRMPVVAAAAHLGPAQLLQNGSWAQYELMQDGTQLAWLGDWILLPGLAGRIFPQAYSPGDMVALAGLAVVLFLATRPAPAPRTSGGITTP